VLAAPPPTTAFGAPPRGTDGRRTSVKTSASLAQGREPWRECDNRQLLRRHGRGFGTQLRRSATPCGAARRGLPSGRQDRFLYCDPRQDAAGPRQVRRCRVKATTTNPLSTTAIRRAFRPSEPEPECPQEWTEAIYVSSTNLWDGSPRSDVTDFPDARPFASIAWSTILRVLKRASSLPSAVSGGRDQPARYPLRESTAETPLPRRCPSVLGGAGRSSNKHTLRWAPAHPLG
jgi:hypothetical protein